jgi:alkylation response protein AidB-like acyl-CoA dehydrogenase
MDFELTHEQRAIVDAVDTLCQKQAGPKRALSLDLERAYDDALHGALEAGWFFDVVSEVGLLEAVLVLEVLSRHAAVVSYAASGVVLPALGGARVAGPLALCSGRSPSPVRFLAHAEHALVIEDAQARLCPIEASARTHVQSNFMVPLGRLEPARLTAGERVGEAQRASSLWRLAIAAECVGAMDAALDLTVRYVSERRQFGRAIGSFQAVQHRLALAKVQLEGARYLTYEAAYFGGDAERSALAAAHATQAARLVHSETHQLTGALGFTREHDLFVWSMRLQALRVELDGMAGHRRALAVARWGLTA